jgi:hypothetical protein
MRVSQNAHLPHLSIRKPLIRHSGEGRNPSKSEQMDPGLRRDDIV